jgi:Helix-turn-helix domain
VRRYALGMTTHPPLPYLLTPAEVGAWLCLPERRVLRMTREGALPHVELPGGEIMFEPAALSDWIERHRRPVAEGTADA